MTHTNEVVTKLRHEIDSELGESSDNILQDTPTIAELRRQLISQIAKLEATIRDARIEFEQPID